MNKVLRRGAVHTPAAVRAAVLQFTTTQAACRQFARHASSAPTIAQPSFWKSLVPKPMRQWADPKATKKPQSKEWNPATFFIVIFLFIGSMAIQMIALRRDFNTFTRRAEVRIGLLREVVEKLQRGEEVDVKKTLGTDEDEQEKEWEEVLREIERDDILKQPRKRAKTKQSESTASPQQSANAKPTSESAEAPKTKASAYSSFF
jgi:hypothetical protein